MVTMAGYSVFREKQLSRVEVSRHMVDQDNAGFVNPGASLSCLNSQSQNLLMHTQ